MTAIFGLIHHDSSPVPPALILATRQSMAHHAEHGMETWQGKKALLGQALTRFWRNSARTATPEQDPARGLTLVADARLDNRADLANRLRLSSADLASLSDARLLLYAYRAWGEETPRYLRGDFVFAVWDEKNQSLFAARDPIGIRWFYYNAGPRRFAFASDPAGLLELMEEDPCLDLDTLDGFLTFQNNAPIETTLYQNVHKLQPGESLRLRDGALQTFRYWQAKNITPMRLPKDPHEGAQVLRGLLREAVANRAQTADRLGAHLSGGLDSSALAALAAQIQRQSGGQDPLAFSWSPPLEMRPLMEKDERVYVQSIADHLHLPVTYTHVPPLVDAIQETSDPSLLPINTVRFEQTIMENARQQGVRVLLSGWGGDELVFSRGIGYPSGLIQRGRFLALALYFKRQYGWKPHRWLNSLYKHGIYPLLPPAWQYKLPYDLKWERDPVQRAINRKMKEEMFNLPSAEFFQPGFLTRLQEKHTPIFEWIAPGLRGNQLNYLKILLGRVESWSAWAARQGARHVYPLLDQSLVEFALSMPEDWVYYGGKTRQLGMEAIADALPPHLFHGRDKQDRALFAHQKTIEHKSEVRAIRLQIFEQHRLANPPASRWLNFDYLHRILQEAAVTAGQAYPAGYVPQPRHGLWQTLNFAFIHRRATLKDEP